MGKEKISETKDREYIYKLLSSILEASSDATGDTTSDTLPRIVVQTDLIKQKATTTTEMVA